MNLLILGAILAVCGAAKLDRTYLPPESAISAGGSLNSLRTPFRDNNSRASSENLPRGSFVNEYEGVVTDAVTAGTRSATPEETGLGAARPFYGSLNSKVGDDAFRTASAGFRQPSDNIRQSSLNTDQMQTNVEYQTPVLSTNYQQNSQVNTGQLTPVNVPDAEISGFEGKPQVFQGPRGGFRASASASFNDQQASINIDQGTPIAPEDNKYYRAQSSVERNANTLRFDSEIGTDVFSYGFETDNGISAEESGLAADGVKAQGGFSYIGDDGQVYSVTYTADEGGYQPKGAHLPTPPPIPVEILKALEQNERDEAAGLFDDGSYDSKKYNTANEDGNYGYNRRLNEKQYSSNSKTEDYVSASSSFIDQNKQPFEKLSNVEQEVINQERSGKPISNRYEQTQKSNSNRDQAINSESNIFTNSAQQNEPALMMVNGNQEVMMKSQTNQIIYNQRQLLKSTHPIKSLNNGLPINQNNKYSSSIQGPTLIPDTELTTPLESTSFISQENIPSMFSSDSQTPVSDRQIQQSYFNSQYNKEPLIKTVPLSQQKLQAVPSYSSVYEIPVEIQYDDKNISNQKNSALNQPSPFRKYYAQSQPTNQPIQMVSSTFNEALKYNAQDNGNSYNYNQPQRSFNIVGQEGNFKNIKPSFQSNQPLQVTSQQNFPSKYKTKLNQNYNQYSQSSPVIAPLAVNKDITQATASSFASITPTLSSQEQSDTPPKSSSKFQQNTLLGKQAEPNLISTFKTNNMAQFNQRKQANINAFSTFNQQKIDQQYDGELYQYNKPPTSLTTQSEIQNNNSRQSVNKEKNDNQGSIEQYMGEVYEYNKPTPSFPSTSASEQKSSNENTFGQRLPSNQLSKEKYNAKMQSAIQNSKLQSAKPAFSNQESSSEEQPENSMSNNENVQNFKPITNMKINDDISVFDRRSQFNLNDKPQVPSCCNQLSTKQPTKPMIPSSIQESEQDNAESNASGTVASLVSNQDEGLLGTKKPDSFTNVDDRRQVINDANLPVVQKTMKEEDFSGPRQQQRFDTKSGYYYK